MDLGLFDERGNITNLLLKGEMFTIKERIHFNTEIQSPIFTYTIKDKKGTEPVSYTHLDVYKRQGEDWAMATRSNISCSSIQWYSSTNFFFISVTMTYPPPKVKALRYKVERKSFARREPRLPACPETPEDVYKRQAAGRLRHRVCGGGQSHSLP